ncbi:NAD+ kinase [Halohasta litchfieldiae]|jgi:NAD+ kinase|uniref:NAD kinase n=1 Tax=Halohasta litchfieldiae TaxID=1073996 RepID=A0A1H6WPZ3_9EURY|nr:NAD(+)/NADH kinase [Halohasta litchfieldiae]ATW87784.1 NAD+ kinase [Halohasta litchfieldiae]SEJ14810.1 NAD+ kinase [Halohasta litchfieldiae]
MEVGIVAQRGNSRATALAAEIRATLGAAGVDCRLDEATASTVDAPAAGADVDSFAECDLVVSIGGDGTFLFAARGAGGTPILGVNLGEVGFLNAVRPDEAIEAVREEVESLREGRQEVREAPRLTASFEEWESVPAVNEIVVTGPRRGHGGGATFEVEIDGSHYTSGHADGILIATPTGSSAYNLSESGPLVHPSINGLIINEMCGTEAMPPLVVAGDCEVTISVADADHVVVVSDGRRPHELDVPCEITVSRAEPPVRLAGPVADFFEALGKLS